MKTETKKEIARALKALMDLKQISQNLVAAQIDISPATVSNVVTGKWEDDEGTQVGVSDRMWLKISLYLGLSDSTWKIKETPNYRNVINLCNDAQENKRMLAVAGPTGLGKTIGLKSYASTQPGAFYMICTNTMTRRDFLIELIGTLGIESSNGNIHTLLITVVKRLKNISNPLIILDDMLKMNDTVIKIVQIIYDYLEGHCGFVLSGTDESMELLFKNAMKGKIGFRELKRRIGYWQPLRKVTMKDVKIMSERYEISDEPALEYIFTACKDYGSLRELLVNYGLKTDALVQKDGKLLQTQREILAGIHFGHEFQKAA